MGTEASLTMLCSVISEAISLVNVFVSVYSLIIFFYILSSWLPLPYNARSTAAGAFSSTPATRISACSAACAAVGGVRPFADCRRARALALGYALTTILAQFG